MPSPPVGRLPGGRQRVGVRLVGFVEYDSVGRAENLERSLSRSKAMALLVEDERVDYQQGLGSTDSICEGFHTVPSRFAIENRKVESRIEGNDRDVFGLEAGQQ